MVRIIPPRDGSPPAFLIEAASLLGDAFASEDLDVWIRPSLHADRRRAAPDLVLGGPSVAPTVLAVLSWGRSAVAPAGKGFLRVEGESGVRRHPFEGLNRWGALLAAHLSRLPDRRDPRTVLWLPYLSREILKEVLAPDLAACDLVLGKEQSHADALRRALRQKPGIKVHDLRAAVEPQLHFFDLRGEIQTPARTAGGSPADPPAEEWGFFLDRKQERMACELASPRTLVYGPAGSGKTIFLMARAQYWLNRKAGARVLLTCYNASLSAHMRRSLKLKGIHVDGQALTVLHYHDLCRELLGLGREFHEQAPEFYAVLEPKVLKRLSGGDEPETFDLILVDEGQDFSRRMFEVLARLSSPGGEITVVADPAQDIYLRWSEANLEPLGDYETERLVDCYRNAAPIFNLAQAVIPKEARRALGMDRLEMTRPEDLGRTGPPPGFVELDSLDAWMDHVEAVYRSLRSRGKPASHMAILYTDRRAIPEFAFRLRHSRFRDANRAHLYEEPAPDPMPSPGPKTGSLNPGEGSPPMTERHFVLAVLKEMEARGIPVEWVTKDFETKAAFDLRKPRVVISTIHSAKGMDFDTVVLLGAEVLKPGTDARVRALLFAGITRAREMLWLPYFRPTGWIPELRRLAGETVAETD